MTVSVPGQLTYSTDGDGVTTSFSYPVRFLAKAEIKVYLRENGANTLQVLNTHYTIAGSSWPSGGNIVFLTPPTALQKVVRYRDTAATQTVDLANTQRNDAPAAEVQFDRHAMVEQDIKEQVGRSWKADFGSVAGNIVPGADDTVGVWSGGNLLGDGPTVGEIANAADNAADAEESAIEAAASLAATLAAMYSTLPTQFATRALAALHVPLVAATFVATMGLATVGDGGGTVYRLRSVIEADGDGDFAMTTVGGAGLRYAVEERETVTPIMFGAVGASIAADTAAFQAAGLYAARRGVKMVVDNSYVLGNVDLTAAVGGNLRMVVNGLLAHEASASTGYMIATSGLASLIVTGTGRLDGNYANQTNRTSILECATLWNEISIRSIVNVQQYGLDINNPNAVRNVVTVQEFSEGRGHTGTAGQNCIFILLRPGSYNSFEGGSYSSTFVNAANQSRNPSAILITGSDLEAFVNVEGNTFENLGYSSAGNHVCVVDSYMYSKQLRVANNRWYHSRFVPLRVGNAGSSLVEGNWIEQTNQQNYNDAGLYADATAIAFGIVDRGYPNDDSENYLSGFRGNTILISGGFTCRALSGGSSSSVTNTSHHVVLTDNFIASSGVNAAASLFVDCVKALTVRGGTINWPGGVGIRMQQTSLVGAPVASEPNASLLVDGVALTATIGVYADTTVANLNVELRGGSIVSTVFPYYIRGARNLTVRGVAMGANGGDVLNLASLIFEGNTGPTAYPVSFTTCTAYRIVGNPGLVDTISGNKSGYLAGAANANFTLTPGTSSSVVRVTATMTADRTVALTTTGAVAGVTRWYISRTAAGAFNLIIGATGKNLAAGQWCIVDYDGTAYFISAYGSL
jgi:hypothetical protein